MSDRQKAVKKKLPVGSSDFRKLREGGYHYVDKSLFIRDIAEASAEVTLLPRPRRFGKTLNLSMLRYFFEKSDEDRSGLFGKLAIRDDECFEAHQGKYPVIRMTFKDIREGTWDACYKKLTGIIRNIFRQHREMLLSSEICDETDRKLIRHFLEKTANSEECEDSLRFLSECLFSHYQKKVVILIDEYDTPLHAGYAGGYYKDAISFIRNFLSGGLKDNEHLFRGVLTGILRVAKESVFSGLNNPGVYTVLSRKFSDAFGFTVPEVRQFLEERGMGDRYEDVSHWYNGYLFGGRVIFNPWSVINYADNEGEAKPYWINTADTGMIDRLATRGSRELREEIGQLLEGRKLTKPVYESIVMRDLEKRDDLLWSFLLFSGYLKLSGPAIRRNFYELEIPNEEVRIVYEEMVGRWFAEKTESNQLEEMLRALEIGDVKLFEKMLRLIVMRIMSYHDLAGEPEKVYHALVLGMLVWMSGKYEMRSNRESGYGRYDLMLKPDDPEGQGIIIEFKRLDEDEEQDADDDGKRKKRKKKKTPQDALEEALKQIEDRGYADELEAAGIRKILKLAVVFSGKKLWVKQGGQRHPAQSSDSGPSGIPRER
ncbi:AAA family ATPase [Desulfococcaceae bacterium HSG8]|nr:AAA family ATPase [Desulfococcaceae bacterium HSG8]